MSDRFVVLSGCSGGGKSTLLAELRNRGYTTVDEPGRRIVTEEIAQGGTALPWIDLAGFAWRAIEVALADREEARTQPGWVFFDRSLIDAASALEQVTAEPTLARVGFQHRYYPTVFLTPPWAQIFHSDPERRHGWDEAVTEYDALAQVYPRLGYRVIVLPKASVEERADVVLNELTGAAATAAIVR